MVLGEAGGTGKFLEIAFLETEGDIITPSASVCEVTATKVSSDQIFTFKVSDPGTYLQKVGAGTVLLEASDDSVNGWNFDHFVINDISVYINPVNYKTEKLDIVSAVYVRQSFTIVASAGVGGSISPSGDVSVVYGADQGFTFVPEVGYHVLDVFVDGVSQGPLDDYTFYGVVTGHSISVGFEINSYTIVASAGVGGSISPSGDVSVDEGTPQTFVFNTIEGHHVSSVVVDGEYITLVPTEFTAEYSFENVIADHTIDVFFSPNGEATIPEGFDVTVFLSSTASLTFNEIGTGYALGNSLESDDDVIVWQITVEDTVVDQVIVALRYVDDGTFDENALRLYRSDVEDYELYLKVDFNNDGVVNGQDVKVISNIIKHPKFIPDPITDPIAYQEFLDAYDLDGSGTFDELDVHIVNQMKNIEWIDITLYVDPVNDIIYGTTDHFSIFRGR